MVRLVTTPTILSAFEAIPPSSRKDLQLPESLTAGSPISHDQIIRIARFFRKTSAPDEENSGSTGDSHGDSNADRSLDALLRGTKLYIPPPPPKPEPSPEYLAHKARLLAAAESDAYSRMLAPSPLSSSNLNPANSRISSKKPEIFNHNNSRLAALHNPKSNPEVEDPNYTDPLTPSLVLNIFLSVLITGFSVYWALTSFATPDMLVDRVSATWRHSSPELNSARGRGTGGASEPVRVLLSLFAALGVGVAEVCIYAIYLGKIEKARGKEGKMKERKIVVEREEVGGKDRSQIIATDTQPGSGATTTTGTEIEEKDEDVIWGRGPNGGLRRRVREKWEESTTTKDEQTKGGS
ncbi:endoplasmic reticulum-based factor for assembly of V-ATPase-domain-containing protein [Aspergillus unguis]